MPITSHKVTPLARLFIYAFLIICNGAAANDNQLTSGDIPYNQLIQGLNGFTLEQRADFVYIALENLAINYRQEAKNARDNAQHSGSDNKVKRTKKWAASVERYANNLSLQASSINADSNIRITSNGDKKALIRVDNQSIIITSPKPSGQRQLEHTIAAQFCQFHHCERIAVYDPQDPTNKQANIRWSFQQQGPACRSDDGIQFAFDNMSQLGDKKQLCQQLASELQNIANNLMQLQSSGAVVDINQLSLKARGERGESTITVNKLGQSIQLSLPSLSLQPRIFAIAKPWLRAQYEGREAVLLIENAEQLM
ncbi:hypothetical protein [Sinobacterium norvegicum]|uniref:hypothetical protein n=1 Tax=Sinobacterium norvegicum TaxID=1641715 RepID=UPI001F41C6E1|nr:hypothetical protein [Sinobacterium norvegicum]